MKLIKSLVLAAATSAVTVQAAAITGERWGACALSTDCVISGDECCEVWANNFPARGNARACVPPLRTMVPVDVVDIWRGYTIHCTTN